MTGPTMTQAICTEHTALLRMWGRLQNRLSAQCQAQAQTLEALASEVLRLRADLLITRTALYWGMAPGRAAMMKRPLQRATPPSAAPSAADGVLCRTACEGHAHHWLDDDHACARTGQACHRLTRAG